MQMFYINLYLIGFKCRQRLHMMPFSRVLSYMGVICGKWPKGHRALNAIINKQHASRILACK